MRKLLFIILLLLPSAHATLAAPASIEPGAAGAPVSFENAEIISARHPALWIRSTRASAWLRGHEPHRAIDGKNSTDWRVSGPPPAPMVRGNWLEIELSDTATVGEIEVHWLGDARYDYKIYKMPRDDFRELLREDRSAGGGSQLEKIELPAETVTRVIRVEFATADGNALQGIREIRIGGVPYPDGYPNAASKHAPVETVQRLLYVEFERLPMVTHFDPKLPYADGGTALRLLPRDDAFEGGHADFTIATTPGTTNWITLKLWECHEVSMTRRGDLIVIETLDGDITQKGRTFVPAMSTEQLHVEQDWNGLKPQPGRWCLVHYQIPAEVVGNRTELRIRLQGVGNVRRDYPMRHAAPPVYSITSSTVLPGS